MTDLFTAHRGVDTQTEEKILARLYGEPLEECPDGLYIPPEALRVFLASFEGPLDLLLYLIRKQKFDVMDIPMAELTDQYMRYVDLVRESDLGLEHRTELDFIHDIGDVAAIFPHRIIESFPDIYLRAVLIDFQLAHILAAYYQNYINIGQRECQLGFGLNMSNIHECSFFFNWTFMPV